MGVKISLKHNERQKVMKKGVSKLFELYSPINKTTMKGSKLFEPYLQVAKNIVKGLKLFKPFCIRTNNFET